MTTAKVTKMSGSGNDFLVLGTADGRKLARDVEWVRRACRRGLSVGADGVLVLEPLAPDRVRVEFRNPDGSRAFCGNGTRCAARYARLQNWAGESLVLETVIGEVQAEILGEQVRLKLPPPLDLGSRCIEAGDEELSGRQIDAGAPHFVVFVESLEEAPLQRWGPLARRHPRFGSAGINLDLVELGAGEQIRLRTWERGVEAETLACGSGALAAAFAARLEGAGNLLSVLPASGIAITVELPGPRESPHSAVVTGDARLIFEGKLGTDAVRGFEAR